MSPYIVVGRASSRNSKYRNRIIQPVYEIWVLITPVSSEGSGEPTHTHSLAKVFDVHMHKERA